MVKSLLSSTLNTRATTAGATQYWLLGTGPLTVSATEANVAIPYGAAGTFSKLYIRITANTTSAPSTLVVRKNGVDTALTLSIGVGVIGPVEDSTNSLTISATDKVNYKTVSGGTGAVTISIMSVIFDAATNCISKLVADGVAHALASVGRFSVISGAVSGTTTSGTAGNNTITKVATFKNFATYVSTNARTTNTVFTLRKNAVNTAVTLTYGNVEAGLKEDRTHTSVTAVNDVLDYITLTGTGTETLTTEYQAIEAEHPTHGLISASSMGGSADQIANFATTWYVPIGGSTQMFSNETLTRQKTRANFTFSGLTLRANVNTLDGTCVVTFRKNATDTPLSVTMAAGSTTPVTDSTNTVSVTENDEINLKIVSLGTTGAITIRQLAVWAEAVTITPPAVGSAARTRNQGRSPLYRLTKPKIVAVIIRLKVQLEYEVTRLIIAVAIPYVFEKVTLIKYASAVIIPLVNVLPLRKRPTPKPTIRNIITQLPYEVQTLRLRSACAYEVDKLITRKKHLEILRIAMNYLVSDFTSHTKR